MTEMLRFNTGKAELSYFPSSFWRSLYSSCRDNINMALVNDIAQVLTFGAKKYSRDNWRTSGSWCKCADSALRHLVAYTNGETHDSESGLAHLAHFGCNLVFLIEFRDSSSGLDDRYKRPATQTLIPFDEDEEDTLVFMLDLFSRWLENEQDDYLDATLFHLNNLYGDSPDDQQ